MLLLRVWLQGESIEEAVAREVREESGAEVTHVDILGSQPWPIGAQGSAGGALQLTL